MAYQRVEVLTGRERRRSYTPAEKVRMVKEAFRPGVVVMEAARRPGVHESLLYRWRDLMKATGAAVAEPPSFVAVTITLEPSVTEPPVAASSGPLSPPSAPDMSRKHPLSAAVRQLPDVAISGPPSRQRRALERQSRTERCRYIERSLMLLESPPWRTSPASANMGSLMDATFISAAAGEHRWRSSYR
ncbi:transposase [Azospirillum sp. 11R-A]|uniref:transposase n=1 Tax=Azospirillum sp. 11R-A TaxID=3111634 RepID=UPI003C2ADF81